MASVFATTEGPCGVFGGTAPCGGGDAYVLSHARAAHLFYGVPPAQDARGEVLLSYIGIGPMTIAMQPEDRDTLREIHGIVVEVAWRGFASVGANLRELDRVMFFGQHLEIVQVAPWPDHLEVVYKEVGR